MMLALSNIFNLVSFGLYVVVLFGFYVVQIWAGLGPSWPNEVTTCFRVGLGHCFYLWDGMTRPKFFWAFFERELGLHLVPK
jgi:hypothetical protein